MHLHKSLLSKCSKRMKGAILRCHRDSYRIFQCTAVGVGVFPAGADGAMVLMAADASRNKNSIFLRSF
jgi:hypothetical protein